VQGSGEITSKNNPRIKEYQKLKKRSYRYDRKKYLGEGIQMLKESLTSGSSIEALFLTSEGEKQASGLSGLISERCDTVYHVSSEVMSALSGTVTPQGIVAVLPFIHAKGTADMEGEAGPLVLLDQVRDPGNLGTMIRAADAAGMSAVIISKRSADLYNPKTVRASAGSILHLPIWIDQEPKLLLGGLKDRGYSIVAADAQAEESFWEYAWSDKTVIILGNEAWGIPKEDEGLVDHRVSIPIFGKAESLNVAAAAALLFYEMKRHIVTGTAQ
jgi:TrmH family RNA methyltransferase